MNGVIITWARQAGPTVKLSVLAPTQNCRGLGEPLALSGRKMVTVKSLLLLESPGENKNQIGGS